MRRTSLALIPPDHSHAVAVLWRGFSHIVHRVAQACLLLLFVSAAVPAFGQAFLAEWTASANGGVGPTGMAMATEGTANYLYVSDHPRGRIIKFDLATGAIAAVFGQQGNANGQFNQPYGIAIERTTGDLYIAERANHRVQRITNRGAFVMAWGGFGTAQGQFNEPIGVTLDSAGNVYVTEHTNHRVQKFRVTQTGTSWAATNVAMWGSQGSANGQFNVPYGILADSADNIYVADGFNGRVQRFNATGVFQSMIGASGAGPGQFIVPTGIALDAAGALYVSSTSSDPQNAAAADSNSQWISKFSSAGVFASRWGGAHGGGPGQFKLPFSVVIGPNNRAYVADYYNSRVQIFDLAATTPPPPPPPPPASGAPTVASFTLGTTTATSVTFQVTFSTAVTGVDAADFSVVTSGGATATLGTLAGSGASYTVPVTFAGSGTVQLNVKASGTGIADASGTAFSAGATGPTYTIPATSTGPDTTAPTVASFTVGTVTSSTINFQITFSEAVKGVTASAFSAVPSGSANATIGSVTGSGASYVIPVTFSGTGTVQLNLKAAPTGISDLSGNALATAATGPTHTIGATTPPPPPPPPTVAGTKIISVTPPANGVYASKQSLNFTVRFSGNVTVVPGRDDDDDDDDDEKGDKSDDKGGKKDDKGSRDDDDDDDDDDEAMPYFSWTPVAATGVRGTGGKVHYVSGSGTSTLIFSYKVKKADSAPAGIALGTTLQLPSGAAIKDTANKPLPISALALPWSENPLRGIVLDGTKSDNGNNSGSASKKSQVIVLKPVPGLVVGEPITLTATSSSGLPVTFVLVSGNATLNGNVLTPKNKGAIVLRVSQAGSTTVEATTLEFRIEAKDKRTDRLVNLSSRLRLNGGDPSRAVIAGFVVAGGTSKQVLIRAIGPGLAGFGIRDSLASPRLQLRDREGKILAENSGWNNSGEIAAAGDRVGAFKLTAGSRDAALIVALPPGAYTAQVLASGNGITLLEVYDAATGALLPAEQLVNISTRGFVETGEGQLVAGFVVAGDMPKRVLIRGIGPTLAGFGVSGTLADPVLKLYAAGGNSPLAQNDDWQAPQTSGGSGAAAAASAADVALASSASGAFPLGAGSKDAALIVTLPPGGYSAVMSGANNGTGTGLIEVYEIPNP